MTQLVASAATMAIVQTFSILLIASTLFPLAFGQTGQTGQCPCHFNFSTPSVLSEAISIPPETNDAALKAFDLDIGCFGAVPLIAGVKNLETDEQFKDQMRQNLFTLSMVIEHTCGHYGAYPAVFKVDDIDTAHKLLDTWPDLEYSLFFYQASAAEGVTTTMASTAISNYSCGILFHNPTNDPNKDYGTPNHTLGTCEDLVIKNRKVDRALCMAAPIDTSGTEKDAQFGQCQCPCTFWQDDEFRCTRDVVRCYSVNNTDDMISTCATVGAAPALVARVPDPESVPLNWITDALFFIGESNNNFTIDDNVDCGYLTEDTDENGEPINTVIWSRDDRVNGTCQEFLEYMLVVENTEFFSVLCTTTMINTTLGTDCSDETAADVDVEDCGAKGLFDPIVQTPLMVGLMLGVFWMESMMQWMI